LYGVPTKYKNNILAQTRQVLGKATIDYSAPEIDSSIAVTANENAHITQNKQVANNVEAPTKKWASLDGSWVLDGTYYLCPDTEDAAVNNEMGWWGRTLAGMDGIFYGNETGLPYLGKSLGITGQYPCIRIFDDIAYLSFVTSTGIFIYSVDDIINRTLTLKLSIAAANVKNARFCTDGTLFYAVWENTVDGNVYYFDGTTTAQLAVGAYPDILYYDSTVYYFWVKGGIYQKTGSTMTTLATVGDGETIKGLRVFLMPDNYIMPCYIIETATQDEIRVITSYAIATVVLQMTANDAPSPFIASAKAESSTHVKAFKAFDRDKSTSGLPYWFDSTGLPSWVAIKLDAAKSIVGYSITPTANTSNWNYHSAPIDFIIQGSNDGTAWTDLDTQTGLDQANPNAWWSGIERKFNLASNSGPYLYYRLYVTKYGWFRRSGDSTGTFSETAQCLIGELQFYTNEFTYNTVHTADKGTLSNLEGGFNIESLFLHWQQGSSYYGRALPRSEMYTDDVYNGSDNLGDWDDAAEITVSPTADNLAILATDGKVYLAVWDYGGELYYGTFHPCLTVEFSARVVSALKVVGDLMRKEYPVDFNVYLYDSSGNLLYTEAVTGNTGITWEKNIGQTSGVKKIVLELTRWSHEGRQAKILEFFSRLVETYEGNDLHSLSLLEERDVSNGSLPIGNISSNELDLSIYNRERKFDAGNSDSKLYQMIKPNRKVIAWLGLVTNGREMISAIVPGVCLQYERETTGTDIIWVPLGTFYAKDWTVPELKLNADVTAQDRLSLLDDTNYAADEFLQNATLYDLAVDVLTDAGLRTAEYWIDEELKDYTVDWGCAIAKPDDTSHRECLRLIVEACLGQCYVDRDGVIRIEGPSYLENEKTEVNRVITSDHYFDKDNPANYEDMANYIQVTTQPLAEADEESDIYTTSSEEPEEIEIGETKTITVGWDSIAINCNAELEAVEDGTLPSGLTITDVVYRPYGADITVSGATAAGTFLIKVTGTVLSVDNEVTVTAQDAASISENGKKTYEIDDNPLIQTEAIAQKIADKCLALSKDPRRDLELTWRGDPALILGDRINVPDSKRTTADFWVISQQLDWDGTLEVTTKGKKVM
jgi:hypothetical protein